MKKLLLILAILIIAGSGLLFADAHREVADRAGRMRLGADLTMPTLFISLDLTEFLGGPTIHYGLTDRLELKATVAPLLRVSYWLTQILQSDATNPGSFAAIGLVEAGARYYLSPYVNSWFLDGELVAGFIAADYDFINDTDTFMFQTAGAALGASVGYDWGNLSVEAGAYFITPNLNVFADAEDAGGFGDIEFLPFPKVSVTYMF